MKAIHQLVAGYAQGDAISNEVRMLRGIFRSWGYESDVFCELRRILPELRGDARDLSTAREAIGPDDVVLLHLSIGSDANDLFPTLPGRKAILYHNITPPEFFRGVQESVSALLARGLRQAKALAGSASVVMADSAFNAREIEAMGQDLLNAFYYFQRYVQPASRFIHVGSFAGLEQYHALLLARARELQLQHVDLVGTVSQAELNAFYDVSRLFLCLSDHEGFCIPLIEAMTHRLPVLAYAAGAVPETLDGAGVLFREKRFDLIAETMGRVAEDATLRDAIIRGQDDRLARYEAQDLPGALRRQLAPLL